MRRILALLSSAASLAIGYYVYTHYVNHPNSAVPATQLPAASPIQGAQNAVQQDQNYANTAKDTVQNQLHQ